MKVTDIKYGLIVIDSEEEGDKNILHFCGYENPVTKEDADALRHELMTDEEFGLTEIIHRLDILPCPDELLKRIISITIDNPDDVEITEH